LIALSLHFASSMQACRNFTGRLGDGDASGSMAPLPIRFYTLYTRHMGQGQGQTGLVRLWDGTGRDDTNYRVQTSYVFAETLEMIPNYFFRASVARNSLDETLASSS
jgi:hypothetical protein